MGLHVRKDDMVLVLAGKQARSRGRVLRVYPERQRAVVEGVNFIKRHTRPNPSRNIKGGIVEREAPIHASTVALYSPKLDGPVRTQVRYLGQGGTTYASAREALASYTTPPKRVRKVRVAVKTGEVFE